MRVYYEALHHVPAVDVDRICKVFGPGCRFGGYEPWGRDANHGDPAELRASYEHMATYIPRCVGMRYETIIDDGRTCVIEWVHIVSRAGSVKRADAWMNNDILTINIITIKIEEK